MGRNLLEVSNLSVAFPRRAQLLTAVDDVSFSIAPGETLALVGESGCGKTVTGLSLMGLTPAPGRVTSGQVSLAGKDLLKGSPLEWQRLRGRALGMVFQDPLTSLDPVYNAGEQVAEALRVHLGLSRQQAWRQAVDRLQEVGIPDPAVRARAYPHQLSGGMRQRVMIAAAIACKPSLLIADEPTTALDVTVQAQILDLLQALQAENGMALLVITHDLGVVARIAHRVAVMYAGQIVETGPTRQVLNSPAHPYTAGLLAAVPRVSAPGSRLHTIEGTVPAAGMYPVGCRFHPRCPRRGPGCDEDQALRELPGDRLVRCLYPLSVEGTPDAG